MEPTPIKQLPVGKKFRITRINSGNELKRRLLSLGIALGNELELLHQRKGGVVVAKNGNRVALGDGITEHLQIEVID